MLTAPVERPANLETTALGAAFHAGLAAGLWSGLDALPETGAGSRFEPRMGSDKRERLLGGWRNALERTLSTDRA